MDIFDDSYINSEFTLTDLTNFSSQLRNTLIVTVGHANRELNLNHHIVVSEPARFDTTDYGLESALKFSVVNKPTGNIALSATIYMHLVWMDVNLDADKTNFDFAQGGLLLTDIYTPLVQLTELPLEFAVDIHDIGELGRAIGTRAFELLEVGYMPTIRT